MGVHSRSCVTDHGFADYSCCHIAYQLRMAGSDHLRGHLSIVARRCSEAHMSNEDANRRHTRSQPIGLVQGVPLIMNTKLMCSQTDKMVGGVCGGLGPYLGIDP